MARLVIDGFGQLELNQVAFRRDGRVEAQCEWGVPGKKCENGMIVSVDKEHNKIVAPTATLPLAIVYSAEHMYDERHNGSLKEFYLGVDGGDFLPRVGYLSVGDIFTTNTILDDVNLGTVCGVDATEFCLGAAGNTGTLKAKCVKVYTMPDGTPGYKFQVTAV